MKKIFTSEKITSKLVVLIAIISLFMTIGFSALNQELFIKTNSLVTTPEYSIYIKDVEAKYTFNGGYVTSTPTFNGTETAMYASLPNLDSSIIFNITIKNDGLTSAVLDHTYISLNNSDMKYKLGDISNGKIVKAGYEAIVTIELCYWDNITAITNSDFSLLIDFEFVPYKNYNDDCTLAWDGLSTSQPITRNIYGTDYYAISNANEYAWFVNYVNNTANNAKAILTNNICLNSKSLPQVNTFTGELDGQNRTISGYNLATDYSIREGSKKEYTGMFKNNSGIIQNININASISDRYYIAAKAWGGAVRLDNWTGGITAENNGKIINSSVSGSLSGYYELYTSTSGSFKVTLREYFGAIAGQNKGIIQGCVNKSTMNVGVNSHFSGIAYNRDSGINFGAITGSNIGYVIDSYNNSPLSITSYVEKTSDHRLWYGGIVGDNESESGIISNSYNAGTISHTEDVRGSKDYHIGGAVGKSIGTITNTYYLDSCGQGGSNGTAISSGDLSNINMVIGNYYTKDIRGINGGYPILKWQ